MNHNEPMKKRINQIIEEIKPIDEKEALKQIWEETGELQKLLSQNKVSMMVAGNIGLGKTTTAKVISTFGKIAIDMENAEKKMLKLYYEDMSLYAERLQIDLISQRMNQIVINNLVNTNSSIIYDRTPYEDPLIFASALHHYDMMSSASLEFCFDYFMLKKQELEAQYPTMKLEPDLLILLEASTENGWKRVNIRQRKMELKQDTRKGHGLTYEFYSLLNEYYATFVNNLIERRWYNGPVLVLPEDELEVAEVTNIKGQLYIVKSLREALTLLYS